MIYLDNAATSFPKPNCVYEGIEKCLREYCANPGRGGHAMSIKAGLAVVEARDVICRLFNIHDSMRLCFTKNATEALNLAIKGVVTQGCGVITTAMEHNSVMRPLRTLEKEMGIELAVVNGNEIGEIDPDSIKKEIKSNTVLIVCTLSSNVNGVIMPIREIGKIAREAGVYFLVDASQGAGSIEIDVEKDYIDMMALPGHKGLMGPQGTGCLYVREGIPVRPLMEGGTGSNSEYQYQPEIMPDFLESGTLNTPGIVGLGQGAKYVSEVGVSNIQAYKHSLIELLYDGLQDIKGMTFYSVPDIKRNSGIMAINLARLDSTELSYILDHDYSIATRAGLHCAPSAHSILGTLTRGIVRLSVGYMNTREDILNTVKAMQEVSVKYS
jgi:cysteine desulfurase/selenocysteine lyase